MYSYEDRIRAVQLHLTLGKRATATVRQLGYPNMKALKAWYREFEHSRDLKMGRVLTWQRYPDEQKRIAVNHYLAHGHCLAETVKALGYPCTETLYGWIQELHPEIRHQVLGHTAGVQHSPRAQAGVGHRALHKTSKCAGNCSRAGGQQADTVQLEESATWS